MVEMRDAIAKNTVSATEVVEAFLARIDRYDDALNVYRETLVERARQRAGQVDTGHLTGRLAGVPLAIKDNLCTAYGLTTCASKMLEKFSSPYTATAVAKLEQAGAIVLGKTNMDEFAMGSSTENSAFKPTRNPWNLASVPGGSSGGSAAAVCADLAAASIGSDTGGSIRQPAALCGVVGLKPTYGRVSRLGLVAYASSLDQIGPLGHTVADVAELLQVLSGKDTADSTSADVEVDDYCGQLNEPITNLRIGLAKQYLSDSNHPAVAEAIDRAAASYCSQGAKVIEVDLPHTDYGIPAYYIIATAEASSNLARYDGVHYGHRSETSGDLIDLYHRSRAEGFGDEVKRRIMLGTYVLSSGYYDAYYLRAQKVRRLIKGDFDQAFQQCDAILCPTTIGPAFGLGEKTSDPLAMYLNDVYTVNANLAGIPAISLPAGWADQRGSKLPVGIQLQGPTFGEARLLRIARMFESVNGQHSRPNLGPIKKNMSK